MPADKHEVATARGALDIYRLRDEPRAIILVACTKCDWKAAYSRDELIALHGADRAMPDLLHDLAAPGCSKMGSNWDRCGAHFVEPIEGSTGPDIEPAKFKSRRDAKDWCAQHYPGSPIYAIGADSSQRKSRAMPRKGPLRRRVLAHAPKGPRSAKMRNPAELKLGAKLEEVD